MALFPTIDTTKGLSGAVFGDPKPKSMVETLNQQPGSMASQLTTQPQTDTTKKPTSVVSSSSAASQANGPIQSTLTQAQQDQMAAYTRLMAAKGLNNDGTPIKTDTTTSTQTTPQTPTTPPVNPADQATTDAINQVNHPGQTQYYNQRTGQPEWLTTPTDGSVPTGYGSQDPKTRSDVADSVSAPGGITIKKFSDGTYARFNLTTGEYSQVGAADFQAAKDVDKARTSLSNIQNGILTPAQQSQIDSITQKYTALIQQQTTANSNITGANTIAQNMFGMGNTMTGQGVIQQTINDGIQRISTLQASMNSAIADMKQAFLTDDMNLLNQAYKEYDDSNTGIQKSLDTIQTRLDKEEAKTASANQSVAISMAKKYQDTDEPILPTDSPEVLRAKLQTSPTFAQNTAVAESLSKEEAQFVGDMGLAGASLNTILPSLGLGKAATNTKIQIIKSIVDNAQKLGLRPEEVAQSLMDKQAAGKTYQRLLTQGALLTSAETKVEADFQLIKSLGKKLDNSELKSGIPSLQRWIREGTLQLTNNPDLNNYLANLTTTLTAYGRVVAGSTGAAGITNAANTEAQGLIDKGFSIDTINSFIDNSAIPEMKNTILGYTTSLNSMDRAINSANGTINPTSGILGSLEGSTPLDSSSSTDNGTDWGWDGN